MGGLAKPTSRRKVSRTAKVFSVRRPFVAQRIDRSRVDKIANQMRELVVPRFDIPVVYFIAFSNGTTLQDTSALESFGQADKPFAIGELRSGIKKARHGPEMDK